MRTRQEIKAIGKSRFLANYWPCVGVSFLIPFILSIIPSIFIGPAYTKALNMAALTAASGSEPTLEQAMNILSSMASGMSVTWLVALFLAGPLGIGMAHFFVMNVLGNQNEVNLGTPFRSAFTGYGRKLGGYLWMFLFLFLWGLIMIAGAIVFGILLGIGLGANVSAGVRFILILLGILAYIASFLPVIFKSYSYAMTTYILADCTGVRAQDALKLSMRIMDGHKWELFVFQLSFIGWSLLSALTCGILSIFYVNPYYRNAEATYYLEVREQALRTGVITMGQLEGTEAV